MIFTDSLVSLGVFLKGRSSSRPLLRLARKAAAITLGPSMRRHLRGVESGRNVADGPSRGHGVGPAPKVLPQRVRVPLLEVSSQV